MAGGTEATEETESREFGGFFSSAKDFRLLPGSNVDAERPRGYYIDFRLKARAPWPPPWFDTPEGGFPVNIAQYALGAYERFLEGEGEEWLAHATSAAEHLLGWQRADGAWPHPEPYHHTFPLRTGWVSAMGQGQTASLLVRLNSESPNERFVEAALRGLRAMPVAPLGGGEFPEEFPTERPSYVLNGGLFAIWGLYDTWKALADEEVGARARAALDTVADNIGRWDTGFWSRYDLYPHPIPNVASSAYHLLHQSQLETTLLIHPRDELRAALERWRAYERSAFNRRRAFAQKSLFRLIVPRSNRVARRLPWSPFFRRADLSG